MGVGYPRVPYYREYGYPLQPNLLCWQWPRWVLNYFSSGLTIFKNTS